MLLLSYVKETQIRVFFSFYMYTFITNALVGLVAMTSGFSGPALPASPELHSDQRVDLTVLVSSYNLLPEQTDEDPSHTASGLKSNPEVMAARSRDLATSLPYGTVIRIVPKNYDTNTSCGMSKVEGKIGYRVLTDTMHARKTNQIDIMLDHTDTISLNGKERNPSVVLGLCDDVDIEIVGRLSLKEIPSTQKELAKLFETKKVASR